MSEFVGRHIRLFLVDGLPDGMLTAEIMNWTGHVLYAPRSRIAEVLRRPEAQRTGVYLLLGKDNSPNEGTRVYIGQGDDVSRRLSSHSREKQFWEFVCIITSKDPNLTTAHVRFLESRLVSLVRQEGRASLENGNEPGFDRLPEAETSDMNDFVARLQILLPVLGINFIRPTPKPSSDLSFVDETLATRSETESEAVLQGRAPTMRERPTSMGIASPIFRFVSGSVSARAVEIGGQMIVLKGSQARAEDQPSLTISVRNYREQLKRSGKLRSNPEKDHLEFEDDVAFTSPSAAAQAVMGTSRNGRTDWIVENSDQTYAEWQEFQIRGAENAISLDSSTSA